MNGRQRSKQATYAERFHIKQAHVGSSRPAKNEDEFEEKNGDGPRNYVAPAKQPPRSKMEKGQKEAQSRRVRQEPKFHQEKSTKASSEVQQAGKMKQFKNLDDIPDYDDIVSSKTEHSPSGVVFQQRYGGDQVPANDRSRDGGWKDMNRMQ